MNTRRIVIIGCGAMGQGIATVFVGCGAMGQGIATVFVEAGKARDRTLTAVTHRATKGQTRPEILPRPTDQLHPHTVLATVGPRPDLLLEAVPEIPALKRRILAEAEQLTPAVLATNISSIPIHALAAELAGLTGRVGLDVPLDIARSLEQELGPRFSPPGLLIHMVEEGLLGKKSGRGFYDWTT